MGVSGCRINDAAGQHGIEVAALAPVMVTYVRARTADRPRQLRR